MTIAEKNNDNEEIPPPSFENYGVSEKNGGYWWIKRLLETREPGRISCDKCKADSSKLYLLQDSRSIRPFRDLIWCSSICGHTVPCIWLNLLNQR